MRLSFYRSSILLFVCTNAAAALNYVFQAIMARNLTPADFGLMNALFGLLGILSLPLTVCSTTWTRHWSELVLAGRTEEVERLWWSLMAVAFTACLVASSLLVQAAPSIAWWLKTQNLIAVKTTIVSAAFIILLGLCVPLATARQWFGLLATASFGGALLRIGIGLLGIHLGTQLSGALVATGLSTGILMLCLIGRVRWPKRRALLFRPLMLPMREWIGPVMASLSTYFILGADMLVVRRIYEPQDAGLFAQVMLLGKTLCYVIAPISLIVLPKTTRAAGILLPQEPRVVRRALLMGGAIVTPGVLALAIFAPLALRLLTGSSDEHAVHYLRIAAFCVIPLSLCQLVIPSFLGRRQEKLLFQFMLLSSLLPVGLILFRSSLVHAFFVEGATGLLLLLFLLLNQSSLIVKETISRTDSPVTA